MKYAIDKIDKNYVILEDLNTKKKKKELLDDLPKDLKEGDILSYKDNKYMLDKTTKETRLNLINEKLLKLKEKN